MEDQSFFIPITKSWKFSGGLEINFIRFLLLMESEFIQYPWIHQRSPVDPTARLEASPSDPNYFNLLKLHTSESKEARTAVQAFASLLDAEPQTLVSDIISNIDLSPRAQLLQSLDLLVASYTSDPGQTKEALDKVFSNIEAISAFDQFEGVIKKFLFVIKHLNCLDRFYSPKLGSSCKLSEIKVINALAAKLKGPLFSSAREKIADHTKAESQRQHQYTTILFSV